MFTLVVTVVAICNYRERTEKLLALSRPSFALGPGLESSAHDKSIQLSRDCAALLPQGNFRTSTGQHVSSTSGYMGLRMYHRLTQLTPRNASLTLFLSSHAF